MEATGEQAAETIWQTRLHIWNNGKILCRMLKKAVQQGRRRIETGGVPLGVR